MRRIVIEFIPEAEMRIPGLGDWQWKDDVLHICASIDDGEDAAFLVAIHEATEAWLCRKEGVSELEVDAFDMAFTGDTEPGDSEGCPYRTQHRRACLVEFTAATAMGLYDYGEMR